MKHDWLIGPGIRVLLSTNAPGMRRWGIRRICMLVTFRAAMLKGAVRARSAVRVPEKSADGTGMMGIADSPTSAWIGPHTSCADPFQRTAPRPSRRSQFVPHLPAVITSRSDIRHLDWKCPITRAQRGSAEPRHAISLVSRDSWNVAAWGD